MKSQPRCYVCNSKDIKEFELCNSTVAGYRCDDVANALEQPLFTIFLDFCRECGMLSQRRNESASPLLDKLYSEHVSTQHSTHNPYFNEFAANLIKKYNLTHASKILEIGCNCGLLLKTFRDLCGAEVFGVEPSNAMMAIWEERNLSVLNGYFGSQCEPDLSHYGPFDMVYFRHVFEHVPDPLEFAQSATNLVSPNGVIVLEVPYLGSIVADKRIENVSYSHLHQYTIKSLDRIFSQFDFGLIDHSLVNTDGGSIIAHFMRNKKTPEQLIESSMEEALTEFIAFNHTLRLKVDRILGQYTKDEVVGYGAGAKGQHLIHLLGLADHIGMVVDDTEGFAGMFIPGTDLEIVRRDVLHKGSIKVVLNLAPTHHQAIRSNVPPGVEFIDFVNSDILLR